MPLYEHVYLARQDASAQQVDELTAQLKGVIEGLGGSVTPYSPSILTLWASNTNDSKLCTNS